MIDWIKKGDVVVVKNTPTWGYYTLVEVIGDYHFDRNTPTGDHAHFLDVKILSEINKHSIHVSGDLRSSIDRAQWPVIVSIKRHDEILNLLQQPAEALTPTVPWIHRIRPQSSNITTPVKGIINHLSPKEFEQLIKHLLDEMKFENTKLTAGAGEHGADVVMSVSTPFFDELIVVVQIKHHWPVDDDTTSIDQIRHAFDHYKAAAGLLVTSAEELGVQLQEAIEKLKTDGKTVAVLYGDELYRLALHVLASDTGDDGA